MEAGQHRASPVAGAIASEAEPKPQSFFAGLSGVLFTSSETFTEIGHVPSMLIPLIYWFKKPTSQIRWNEGKSGKVR